MVTPFSHTATPSKSRQKTTRKTEENPTKTTKRHVLRDNDPNVARKTRSKQVCSRYLSPSVSFSSSETKTVPAKTTTRFSSSLISRSTNRSQSVDRRGPVSKGNDVNAFESSAATKMSITSTRSLSVSFQREAFSLPVSKTKGQESDHEENSKPVDRQWWLERNWKANLGSNQLSRSLDCNGERKMFEYSAMLAKSLQRSMMLNESTKKVSLSFDFERAAKRDSDANHVNEPSRVSCDLKKNSKERIKTNSRLRRLSDPGSNKSNQSKRLSSTGTRPARVSISVNSPSNVSLLVDVKRGKRVEDRIVDAHKLRLLYNHYLQWRFVNAKANDSFMVQKLSAEKKLLNASVKTSELRNSVTFNRIKLVLLRQKLKLLSILKGQIDYLEAWSVIDNDKSGSLLGVIEALKASTLLLPIDGKALIDLRSLKDAVGSAVDVMKAMTSSISSLSSKVEELKSVMDELMNVIANEKFLVEQCMDILSRLAVIQVKDCSLRAHLIQLNIVPTSYMTLDSSLSV